ncbi:RHS repeat domain-containing protein [Cochleicola gelatinilyticus]|uniref:RHS repeat-associated core domain-containing protein n=1 Tax=Cochleicola gelatinilyticus TaxID=1763537 RepID=A0A167HL42_9FLAO|nr:RHS repeat-associated core domain-containing protein [Cochleicola gelatinilyticus]OAB78727.1 hypothetical protein ULVI_09095 [Cochleicola gelatinilyticus]
MYYNRFRYYSADEGIYLSQDPIGLAGNNPTLHSYTHNSNIWIDPLGLSECSKLSDEMSSTFLGGKYTSRVIEEDMILYRAGKKGIPLGQFFSKDAPKSVLQTRIDKAILPQWPDGSKSILDTGYKVKIPAGTTIHTGTVGPQGGIFLGGTQQIVVEKPWLIEGIEILDSYPLIL